MLSFKEFLKEENKGLWANIHAKRKRIKNGSGERMRKPGEKGAPTDADFKAASESVEFELDEALLESIRKVDNKYVIFSKDGSKRLGEYDTREAAVKRLRQIEYFKHVNEATYKGREVPLNKPMAGDVKKSKVYVDPDGDGKAKKVEFGDPNMTIKKNNPARRKSFRARHGCDDPDVPKPKDKARYWSCKAW